LLLYLVRHGNHPDGFRGGWSDSGLSALGLQQVAALRDRLRREEVHVDTLLCSDLPRARQTADQLADVVGAKTALAPAWREVNTSISSSMSKAGGRSSRRTITPTS
jgi:broad specificity phosphatase PhoE